MNTSNLSGFPHRSPRPPRVPRRTVAMAAALCAGVSAASDIAWRGTVSGVFSEPANWSGGVTPANNLTANRALFDRPSATVCTNDAPRNLLGIQFATPTDAAPALYVLRGSAFTLGSQGVRLAANVTSVLHTAINWASTGGTQNWILEPGSMLTASNSLASFTRGFNLTARTGSRFNLHAFPDGTTLHEMKIQPGSGTHVLDIARDVIVYLEYHGTTRVTTPGNAIVLSGSMTQARASTVIFGGPTSGDIRQNSAMEYSWGGDKTLQVDNITFSLRSLATSSSRTSGTDTFFKRGSGTLILRMDSTLNQGTAADRNGFFFRIEAGTVLINANFSNFSLTQNNLEGLRLDSGARLGGVGTFATVSPGGLRKFAALSGTVAPGDPTVAAGVGTFTYRGSVWTQRSGSTLEIEVGAVATDRLNLEGALTLEPLAALNVRVVQPLPTSVAAAPLVIAANDGADAVTGTFAGLPEGARLSATGPDSRSYRFAISYVGGDGNDVTLTYLPDGALILVR